MKKIKISAVSYLNTKPFILGLKEKGVDQLINLSLDMPALCAKKLVDGEVDLGLVPVAVIPHIETPHIISDFCIGTTGEVRTVAVFATQPLNKLKRIYLDYQSRTSVELLRILLEKHWGMSPELIPAEAGYEQVIGGDTGGLVIGDRAIDLKDKYPFFYDLGSAWKEMTNLPFVFAAWVSNKPLPTEFVQTFNSALQYGIDHINLAITQLQPDYPTFSVQEYFTKYISYSLDAPKKQALTLFLENLKTMRNYSNQEIVFS